MKATGQVVAVALAGVALFSTVRAQGWDSVSRAAVRNLPRNLRNPDPSLVSATGKLTVQITKERLGGSAVGASNDVGVSSLVSCPADFDVTKNFQLCQLATQDDLPDPQKFDGHAQFGWLSLRVSADAPNASEHYLIAHRAAELAGLLPATTLFDPFFVRYAASNSRIASPEDLANGFRSPVSHLIVGQSWLPTDASVANAHALRSVALLEIAELPDFANSLADWAAGNEVCPLTDLDGAYTGLPAVEACHRFEMAMGAVNVTHFAPLNREMWGYYHTLAKTRMSECSALSQALNNQFYGIQAPDSVYESMSASVTEAHECEREAMAYEMFGQHFMQDAWSSGHMWKRFGYPRLGKFPSDFHVSPGELPPAFDSNQTAPRRAAIALMTAIISGEIHGAKSVIERILRAYGHGLQPPAALTDDPLNAPEYFAPFNNTPIDVEWVSDNGRFPGGGDLFWASSTSPASAVSTSDKWVQERDTLLNCTAKSMLDVYQSGPMLHGQPDTSAQSADLASTDPASDQCWKHYATNASMKAAFGINVPLPFYLIDPTLSPAFLGEVANEVILTTSKSSLGFPTGIADKLSGAAKTAAQQRDIFIDRLNKRMRTDATNLHWLYWTNSARDPLGTDSAKGQGFKSVSAACLPPGDKNCPVTLFDIPPMADSTTTIPESARPGDRDVDYVDNLPSQDSVPDPTAPNADLNLAMSRMFWRGNTKRTCLLAQQNNAAVLTSLRAQCLQGAANGGDPDACTQCVALAELNVPKCQPTGPTVGQSKCSALGANSTTGLPAYWFDNQARHAELVFQQQVQCLDGFSVAMMWCTGTDGATPKAASAAIWDVQQTSSCPNPANAFTYGKFHSTESIELDESEDLDSPNWVFPIVTARNVSTQLSPGLDPCDPSQLKVTTSVDSILQAELANPGSDVTGSYVNEYLAGPEYARCGVRQRRWWAPEGCAALEAQIGFKPTSLGFFFPASGEESLDEIAINSTNAELCMIREPRKFSGSCSAAGTTCNAGGECVNSTAPPGLVLISPPTPPLPSPPP